MWLERVDQRGVVDEHSLDLTRWEVTPGNALFLSTQFDES